MRLILWIFDLCVCGGGRGIVLFSILVTFCTWAQRHQNHIVQQCQHLVFCNEINFILTLADHRFSVRLSNGEALSIDCVQDQVTHGGGLVHVWSGLHYLGETQPCISEQNIAGAFYCEILEQDLVPHVHHHFVNNSVMVDDNAAPHRSKDVHEYLTGEDIIDQSLYNPDMNTIEHMWHEIGDSLEGIHPQLQTLQKLGHF